jgi:hypothetical protein
MVLIPFYRNLCVKVFPKMARKLVRCNFHSCNFIHTDYRILLKFKISNNFLQLLIKVPKKRGKHGNRLDESKKKIVNSYKLWTLNNLTRLALVTKLSHLIYSVCSILKLVWRNNNLNFSSRQGNEVYASIIRCSRTKFVNTVVSYLQQHTLSA